MNQRAKIELLHCDCMDYMAKCKDNEFDLAIVDPPYGINIANNNGFYHIKGYGQANPHIKKKWDSNIPTNEYWVELFRISRNQIVWGGNYMTENLPPSRCWIFWDKMKYVPNYADGELAWTSFDRNTKQVRIQHHGFLNKDKVSIHPTQKPSLLYKWLLDNFTAPNDRILDTHLGSGSIAIACWDLGFDLVGCEIDKDYYDAAVKRFETHKAQLQLF